MYLLKSTAGKKLIMAASGFFMIAFVAVHLLGNTSIYYGPDGINSYARGLRGLGPILWAFRLILFMMFSLHVFLGIKLTLENKAAKPDSYTVTKSLQTTFAGRTMIWTGSLIGIFLVYHLLHFTFQMTDPGISASNHSDAMGRPDVFMMVVLSFRKFVVSSIYFSGMCALGLHLFHSIQSSFQTLGLNSDRTFPIVVKGGRTVSILIYLGYIAIPIVIFTGLLR